MKNVLPKFIDVPAIKMLMDLLREGSGISLALIGRDGQPIVSAGWELCRKVHWQAEDARFCRGADLDVSGVGQGREVVEYTCRYGLSCVAIPVLVEGRHLGTLKLGQFLDRPFDKAYFRQQAEQCGFDTESYLSAMGRIPVLSPDFNLRIASCFSLLINLLMQRHFQTSRLLESQTALQESEQKFRSVFQTAAAGMVLIALDGKILEANRSWCNFFGYSEAEMRQLSIFDLTHPGDRPATKLNYQELLAGRRHFIHYEKRYLRKDGSVIWGHVSASCICSPEGQPLYFIGLVQDLTDHKRSELELLASEKKYRTLSDEFQTLLNGIPDPIVLLSPELRIIWANQGASAKARQAEPITGERCHLLWHQRAIPCDNCPVTGAFASGELEEGIIIGADGRHWGAKAFPLKDKDGQVTRVIEMCSDITEKIRLREEATRATHLASLGALAAGVAHEINNPNSVILLNSDFLAKAFSDMEPVLAAHAQANPAFSPGGVEYEEIGAEIPCLLTEVHDSARRIKRIVEDLKEFVHPTGAADEPVDLNAAVQAATRLVRNEIRKSTDHFVVAYGEDLPKIQGNLQAIEQVAVNLLTNACQSLADRSKGIFLRTWFEPGKGRVMFEVRDEGIGIPRENLPHITDPFFTTRRRSGGTGLGLSISRRIIEAHGGKITFVSASGEGTTTIVGLPLWKEGEV